MGRLMVRPSTHNVHTFTNLFEEDVYGECDWSEVLGDRCDEVAAIFGLTTVIACLTLISGSRPIRV